MPQGWTPASRGSWAAIPALRGVCHVPSDAQGDPAQGEVGSVETGSGEQGGGWGWSCNSAGACARPLGEGLALDLYGGASHPVPHVPHADKPPWERNPEQPATGGRRAAALGSVPEPTPHFRAQHPELRLLSGKACFSARFQAPPSWGGGDPCLQWAAWDVASGFRPSRDWGRKASCSTGGGGPGPWSCGEAVAAGMGARLRAGP